MFDHNRENVQNEQAGKEPSLFDKAMEVGARMGREMWNDAVVPMFNHGRAEAASALFRGEAYVMYGNKTGNEQEQGMEQQVEAPQADAPQQEQEKERGGRER